MSVLSRPLSGPCLLCAPCWGIEELRGCHARQVGVVTLSARALVKDVSRGRLDMLPRDVRSFGPICRHRGWIYPASPSSARERLGRAIAMHGLDGSRHRRSCLQHTCEGPGHPQWVRPRASLKRGRSCRCMDTSNSSGPRSAGRLLCARYLDPHLGLGESNGPGRSP